MQHARRTYGKALRIAQHALRKTSLKPALPFRPCSGQYVASFSTNSGDKDATNQDTQEQSKDDSGATTSSEGPRVGRLDEMKRKQWTYTLEEFEKLQEILPRGSYQPQDYVVLDSAAAHSGTTGLLPFARGAQTQALNAKDVRLAEAFASSIVGEDPSPQQGERDQRSVTVAQALPPFPDIPPYSRDVLTDEQAQTYLDPLYGRGWYVSSTADAEGNNEKVLTKAGTFKTEASAQTFMLDMLRACHKELTAAKEPSKAKSLAEQLMNEVVHRESADAKYTVTREGQSLTFKTYTANAVIPGVATEAHEPQSQSSVTLQDVRLALIIEHMWELQDRLGFTKVGSSELAHDPRWNPSSLVQPSPPSPSPPASSAAPATSTKKQKKPRCFRCKGRHHVRDCPEPQKPPTCLACNGLHHINNCPQRATAKPPTPCWRCGSPDHWSIDCTGKKPADGEGRVQLANRKCYICGSVGHGPRDCPERATRPPKHPCSLCHKDHWVYDCPELKNRPDFLIRDCSYCGGLHFVSQCPRVLKNRRKKGKAKQ